MATALPLITSLSDCADYSKVVQPFLPQVYSLPQRVFDSINSLEGLKEIYVSTNPLVTAFVFSLALAPIFLVVSEINKNYSQVDRCWSLLPTIYNIHYDVWARMNGLPANRLDNIVAFSVLWSVSSMDQLLVIATDLSKLRLTYNYWRKGGYNIGVEDYRWELLRERISPALFFIFNVTFIATAQSVLLFSITSPTYVLLIASRLSPDKLTFADTVFVRILMALVLLEFFADQQQWDFQQAKTLYRRTARVPPKYTRDELDRGFVSSGLWRYSRHPNFAAEQAIWTLLYQWSCYETFTYFNWTFVGVFGYLSLFQGSTWFTELVSAGKYPEYKQYQERVGKFLPKLLGEGWNPEESAPPGVKEADSAPLKKQGKGEQKGKKKA
ncbi:MAG: hypothetical protein M1820_007564 [Bogoriella megaspora]|nr:MAG: hypothetical protein M1820_007564 [Bogoriella megaspora]